MVSPEFVIAQANGLTYLIADIIIMAVCIAEGSDTATDTVYGTTEIVAPSVASASCSHRDMV